MLWCFLETLFHSLNLIAAALGVPTKPCLRNPLLSSSLRDFWARRWNLPTSESLRVTCYDPLVNFLSPPLPKASGSPHTADPAGDVSQSSSEATSSAKATASVSADTVTQRSTTHATGGSAAVKPEPETRPTCATGTRQLRTPREQWVAFAGLSLAFFLSGAVHHWLLGLFTKTPLFIDFRFGILFWIQPPVITVQEAWIRSKWWRGVRARAPGAAWCAPAQRSLTCYRQPCRFWTDAMLRYPAF